eukprot:CAMPEP_0183816114 /NCGR_PEP_ID=MMETSP0803_2-20130417/58072_1 /TAXON_ID=195967 /ORGANISM="Crustomastix stigmata, Strain CCMP3273" /LENGTH=282 /DNA_ID=CAMNT_0026060979 /DNA_START=1 /DNA_END=846 /DNA_ORIENTATION=-
MDDRTPHSIAVTATPGADSFATPPRRSSQGVQSAGMSSQHSAHGETSAAAVPSSGTASVSHTLAVPSEVLSKLVKIKGHGNTVAKVRKAVEIAWDTEVNDTIKQINDEVISSGQGDRYKKMLQYSNLLGCSLVANLKQPEESFDELLVLDRNGGNILYMCDVCAAAKVKTRAWLVCHYLHIENEYKKDFCTRAPTERMQTCLQKYAKRQGQTQVPLPHVFGNTSHMSTASTFTQPAPKRHRGQTPGQAAVGSRDIGQMMGGMAGEYLDAHMACMRFFTECAV